MAGLVELAVVLSLIFDSDNFLKAVAGTGTSLTADNDDLSVRTAQLGPVGDVAQEDIFDLVNGQVLNTVGGVDCYRDAVESYSVLGQAFFFLVLQRTAQVADIRNAVVYIGDCRTGTAQLDVNGYIGILSGECFASSFCNLLHRGGAGQLQDARQCCIALGFALRAAVVVSCGTAVIAGSATCKSGGDHCSGQECCE